MFKIVLTNFFFCISTIIFEMLLWDSFGHKLNFSRPYLRIESIYRFIFTQKSVKKDILKNTCQRNTYFYYYVRRILKSIWHGFRSDHTSNQINFDVKCVIFSCNSFAHNSRMRRRTNIDQKRITGRRVSSSRVVVPNHFCHQV